MGVAGPNMQWGHLFCSRSSQKRESTAFDLILPSVAAWGFSSPGNQVGRSSFPCQKRSQVWGREIERWPKPETPVLNFEKQAQSSKG